MSEEPKLIQNSSFRSKDSRSDCFLAIRSFWARLISRDKLWNRNWSPAEKHSNWRKKRLGL